MPLDTKTADLMINDFPAWEASLNEGQKQAFEGMLKYEVDRDAAIRRFASVSTVAAYTGRDFRDVSQRFESFYMPAFAADQKVGLGKQAGVNDFNEFHNLLKEKAVKNTRVRGWHDEAATAAYQAALAGRPMLDALREWQGVDQGPQEKDRLEITPQFMQQYREINDTLRPHRDIVNRALEATDRLMDGRGKPGDEESQKAMTESLLDMPDDKRKLVLNALRVAVANKGQVNAEKKGNVFGGHLWQQIGESAFRIGKGVVKNTAAIENAIDAVPTKGAVKSAVPQITTPQEATQYVQGKILAHLSERLGESMAADPQARPYLPEEGTEITLDPNSEPLILAAIERENKRLQLRREWARLENSIDPIPSTTANLIGSSGAIIGLTALTRGAALPTMAQGYSRMEYDQLRLDYPEMNRNDARTISDLSGAVQAMLDQVGVSFFDKVPGFKSFISQGITKTVLGRGALRFGIINSVEAGVEVGQDLSTPVIQTLLSKLKEDVPNHDWDKEMGFVGRYKEHWVTMIPLTLVFAGVASLREYSGLKDLTDLNQKLGRMGVPEQYRIAAVDAVGRGDIGHADAILRDADKHRDPAIAAEFGDAIEAQNIEAEQTFKEAQRLGLMPVIERDADGFAVRDTGGGVARFTDWAQAKEAAQSFFTDTELANIEAVAQMADHFLATTPDSLQGGEVIILNAPNETTASRVASGAMSPQDALEASIVAGELEGMTREEASRSVFAILGDNDVQFQNGIRTSVSKVMRNGNVLTMVEEGIEGRWNAGLQTGRFTRDQGVSWVRLAEGVMGEKLLPEQGEVSPRQLTEAISKIVVADVFGRRKDGSRLPAGVVSQGVMAATAKEQGNAKGLRAFLRAFRELFAQVMNRAQALRRARAEGKLTGEWETMLDDLLGVDSQQRYERSAEAEGQTLADEWVDDSQFEGYQNEEGPNGETFSLRRLDGEYLAAVESGDMDAAQRMVDEAAKAAGFTERVYHGTKSGDFEVFQKTTGARAWYGVGIYVTRSKQGAGWYAGKTGRVIDGYAKAENPLQVSARDELTSEQAADFSAQAQRDGYDSIEVTGRDESANELILFNESQIKLADPVTRDSAGNIIPLSQRFNPADNRVTFSLRRAVPADTSNVTTLPDGAQLVGPTTFSLRAYHGTPHKVERFSTDKIGTGEGAQAYGWGLYFAENQDVAKAYQAKLSEGRAAASEIYSAYSDDLHERLLSSIPTEIEDEARDIMGQFDRAGDAFNVYEGVRKYGSDAALDWLNSAAGITNNEGNFYTVDLLPDQDSFLDWDKPLNEQGGKIEAAIKQAYKLYSGLPTNVHHWVHELIKPASLANSTGKDFYEAIVTMLAATRGETAVSISDKAASEWMAQAGVLGIRYLDGNSRTEGEGTSNYVIFDESLVKIIEENGVPRGTETSFSLRSIRAGDTIDRALADRLNAPDKRITFYSKARDQLAKLSLNSLTWRGDVIEGTDSLEQRDATIASLEAERRFRQRARQRELRDEEMANLQPAVLSAYVQDVSTLEEHPLVKAMLNDHGKLMSRTTAENQGKIDTDGRGNAGDYDGAPWLPPKWYSSTSGIMPDVMAQNLYDSGLLNEASTDALWKALASVITGTRNTNEAIREAKAAVRKVEQDAFKQSQTESNKWFNEAVAGIPTAHEKMMAAFRTKDAILAAFPPELRGAVGGYTKLASYKSDKARLKHLLDSIHKLDVALEAYLQKEIREDLEKLFDRAKPKGGPGEKAGGKIGVEGHRIFKAIEGIVDLAADKVTSRITELNTDIAGEPDLKKVGVMLEEQQLLELFGGLNAKIETVISGKKEKTWLKSAAELKAAWDFAHEAYVTGRNKWKAQIEARLDELKELRKLHESAMGGRGTDARLSEMRAKAGKNDGLGLSLLSLVQVLERAYGSSHTLVRRWYGAARKATAQKTDAIRASRREFKALLKSAMPEIGSTARNQAVFDLKTERTVIAPKVEGVSVQDVDIPLETAVKLVAGEADLKAFGLEDHHLEELQTALDEHQRTKSKSKSVTVHVVESAGMQSNVPLTPMQAVHITMLWAQEMYRPGMERHGWTEETIEAIEEQLPPLAVKIRAFIASKYESGYEAMNRVYKRMYGIDLPRIANYAPGTFMHEGQEIQTDPFGQGLIQNGGVRAAFVQQRKQHMARPKWDSDALDLFFAHTSNVEHWKAFAELGREMRSVLLAAESKAATEAQKGKEMMDVLGQWVEIIERGGLEAAKQGSKMDVLARRISSNRSIIALAFNIGTLAKQSTALFGAMMRMPMAAYGRGFMRLFSGRLNVKDIYQQDFIQRRIDSGYSPEAKAAMAKIWDAPPSRRAAMLEWGMELIGKVDGIFTTGTAAIAYDYHYREGIQAGLTHEQARSEALAEAEDVVARVAQPVEAIDRSTFELGAGAWGRLGFMFASDARQKWALLQEAIVNSHHDKATLGRVLAFHLLSGVAIQTISSAWRDARDDDDDELFDPKHWNLWSFFGGVVLGPFGGIPIIGTALDTFSGRGELVEAFLSGKDIVTGKGDMKDVATMLSGLAYLGVFGKWEDAAIFLGVSAKVAKDVLGVAENVTE